MSRNMGKYDRIIRIALAVILITMYFDKIITGTWGIVALIISAIFVVTSIAGICPLYSVLGLNTCTRRIR